MESNQPPKLTTPTRVRGSCLGWALVLSLLASASCGGASGPGRPGDTGGAPSLPSVASVTVDASQRFQTMEGFGGALAFYVNYLVDHPNQGEIANLIFRELGLDILRVGNWYQNGVVDEDTVKAVAAATASLGHPPRLLMSSWSPPASLKSNGDTANGGTLVQEEGAFAYDRFGQWWADALVAHAARGVVPDFISIQNEPDFKASWGSCLFGPTEGSTSAGLALAGYDQALDAVFEHIQGLPGQPGLLPVVPQLLGPEVSGLSGNKLQSYLAHMNPEHYGGVAHHLYSGGSPASPASFNTNMRAAASSAADKPRFMTEYAPTAPDMFTTAWLINEAVTVEGVSAYIYWDLTWQPPGGLVTIETPYDRSMWTTPSGYIVRDTYYALKHFARWVDAGWTRIAATSSVDALQASAFTSPDGSQTTVVLLNTTLAPVDVTLTTGAWTFSSSDIFLSAEGTADRTREAGPLDASGIVTLPARGIVTVTLMQ